MQIRFAASLAKSFAIDASRANGRPASFAHAARRQRRCAASSSVFESASFHWMAWKSAIGCPNCFRSSAYVTDSSSAARAIPMAWALIPMRPPSSAIIAILKPP